MLRRTLLILTICFTSAAAAGPPEPEPLVLQQALSIEGEAGPIEGLEPSGLAVCDGRLLMISDSHSDQVFSIELAGPLAVARTWITLTDIPPPDLSVYDFATSWWSRLTERYDWEGISCDNAGNLYLLSEILAQVLQRSVDGTLRWLGTEAYLAGRKKGLFEQRNAMAEGLAVSATRLVMAAERHPRGLVMMQRSSVTKDSWQLESAGYLNDFPTLQRPQDFTGLWLEGSGSGEVLYTLERNHFQLCRRQLPSFSVSRCWRYEQDERAPAYAYQDQRFGKAEGVARIDQRLYLVLDNNNSARQAAVNDLRPQLFIFALPQNW